MKLVTKLVIGAATTLAPMATASVEVVCNGEGEGWHVKEHVEYRPEFGVRGLEVERP